MHLIILGIVMLLLGCGDIATAPDASRAQLAAPIDVFLVGGQSNARYQEGFVSWDALVAQRGTDSAWPAFARRYYKLTGRKVAIVNAYNPGSAQVAIFNSLGNLTNKTWDEHGKLFGISVAMLDSALSAHPDHAFKGVLWVQGGADAKGIDRGDVTRKQYQRTLARMIARYRTHYPNMPFYIFKTGQPLSGDTPGFAHVRDAQSRVALNDPFAFIAFGRAITFADRGLMIDDLHYATAAYVEMGQSGAGAAANAK